MRFEKRKFRTLSAAIRLSMPLFMVTGGWIALEMEAHAQSVTVDGVDIVSGARGQILINTSQANAIASTYSTTGPAAIVVDILDAELSSELEEKTGKKIVGDDGQTIMTLPGDGEFISEIQVVEAEDGGGALLKIRLFLVNPAADPGHSYDQQGSLLVITLENSDTEDPLAAALESSGEDPLSAALAESEEEVFIEPEMLEDEIVDEEELVFEEFEPDESQLAPLEEALDEASFDDGGDTFEIAQPVEDDPLAEALMGESGDDVGFSVEGDDDPLAAALAASDGSTSGNSGYIETESGPRRLSGPESLPGGASVSSLDFQMQDDVARVIVGIKGTRDFTVSQPQRTMVVVDIPNAFLPQSLDNDKKGSRGRFLDTEKFVKYGSPVRLVRAYRTSTGARIAMMLTRGAEHQVGVSDDGLIYVDIPLTLEEQDRWLNRGGEAAAEVSPQESDSGIENAYRKEVLIGKGGRTVDPQTAFGDGGGSASPDMLPGMTGGFITEVSGASAQAYQGERINLDFMNADIHGIFRLISNYSRWNIVAGDDVQGKVTVQMHEVPWDQAFQAILQSKGLGAQKFGNVVRVAPIETIKAEQQAALEAKRAQEELTELQMQVLPLNYTTAVQMQSQIQDLVSSRGSVQVDNSGNQLIIHETEERIAQIRELVRQLDKATPQVLIEARVVEASSNFTRSLGIEWGAELNASTETGYSTGLFFPNSVGAAGGMNTSGGSQFYSAGQDNLLVDLGAEGNTGALAFSLGSIPGLVDLDARLSAMEADGWGKVVSQPRITTLDNKPARISQGQKIPYLSTSSGGTRVQFIEASLEMSVTPHITSDDKVFLSVELSNDRADFSQLVQGQPAIQIKQLSTEMLVADGDTTVLGGVFSTEESHSQDRVPGFSKIPLLGYLFKNSVEAVTRNELLVFITPHVVTKASIADSG